MPRKDPGMMAEEAVATFLNKNDSSTVARFGKDRWGPILPVLQVSTARFPTKDKDGLRWRMLLWKTTDGRSRIAWNTGSDFLHPMPVDAEVSISTTWGGASSYIYTKRLYCSIFCHSLGYLIGSRGKWREDVLSVTVRIWKKSIDG